MEKLAQLKVVNWNLIQKEEEKNNREREYIKDHAVFVVWKLFKQYVIIGCNIFHLL